MDRLILDTSRARRCGLAGWLLLALAGCSAHSALGLRPGGQPPLPQGYVAVPPPRSAAADGTTPFTGQAFTAQTGANNQNLAGGAYQLGPAANATAWARYTLNMPAASRLTSLSVEINSDALGGAPPPGPYYIALANYGQGTWEWFGPYTNSSTLLNISSVLPRSAYVSPADQTHCVVLNYAPPGLAAAPLAVVGVTFNYTDNAPSTGWATFTYGGGPAYPAGVYRIKVETGALPENLSTALDALSPEATLDDSFITISPDGQWLALKTNRFDPEAEGFAALALVKSDLSSGMAVRAGGAAGTLVHPESIPAVASGGNLIVYSGQGGPHQQDLWAVSRANSGADWSPPLRLSVDSLEDYNENPQISADGSKVVFHCGPTPYGQYGTKCAEVNTDGTGYHIFLDPASPPPGYLAMHETRSPDYAPDGSIIFEADWTTDAGDIDDQRIWRLPAGGGDPILISGIEGGNSPSVLADGRIVNLWLGRPNSMFVHELTVIDADGGNRYVLVPDVDVADIGLGAGG